MKPKENKEVIRKLMVHFRVSPTEKKTLEKKSKGFHSLAEYIRMKTIYASDKTNTA